MTYDERLSLAILCLMMVLQICLMAYWHRQVQHEAKTIANASKRLSRAWDEHTKVHREVNAELLYQARQIRRLEIALLQIVKLEVVDLVPGQQTLCGIMPKSESQRSVRATIPDGRPSKPL